MDRIEGTFYTLADYVFSARGAVQVENEKVVAVEGLDLDHLKDGIYFTADDEIADDKSAEDEVIGNGSKSRCSQKNS